MPEAAQGVVVITPSDSANVAAKNGRFPFALIVNVSGDVRIMHADDTIHTYAALAGVALNISVKRVFATGTTAVGIAGWYR